MIFHICRCVAAGLCYSPQLLLLRRSSRRGRRKSRRRRGRLVHCHRRLGRSVTTTEDVHCRQAHHSLSLCRTIQVSISYFKSLETIIHDVPFLDGNWVSFSFAPEHNTHYYHFLTKCIRKGTSAWNSMMNIPMVLCCRLVCLQLVQVP